MLILSKEYVDERGGDSRNLRLYGQEDNGGVWSISKMNMLLHGIPDADIRNADTLSEPLHVESGELMRYERVITNPPFSQNYTKDGIQFPERFHYGWAPETGKKADLMFVQHMLAVLRPRGIVVTVMPHGVLFRGGEELRIRSGMLDDDLIDSVIGLGPNLFYGTGIPACILVLRSAGSKPPERKGKVLFVNAGREYREGRAQNYLDPEHIEKIVSTWEAFEDVPSFATVVTRKALAANQDNLNIRRYADDSPAPEPQDVRSHMAGGIPKNEVSAQTPLLADFGLDPETLLMVRDELSYEFKPEVSRDSIAAVIAADSGVRGKQSDLAAAVSAWWAAASDAIKRLPESGETMPLRRELLASFEHALRPVGLLDRFQVSGVIATWWGEAETDLKTLGARDFGGLIESWETGVLRSLEDPADRVGSHEHRMVKELLPEYLNDIANFEARKTELTATVKSAKEAGTDNGEEDNEDELSEADLKELKRELTAVKRTLKEKQTDLVNRLRKAIANLDDTGARDLAVGVFRRQLDQILADQVDHNRNKVQAAFLRFWDKYHATLPELEAARDTSMQSLEKFLRDLGYGN